MPTTDSAKKRMRQNKRRRSRNRSWKTRVKTAQQRVEEALSEGEDEETVRELLNEAKSLLDRATSKGIYHENKSARLKSQLQGSVNEALSGEEPEE